MGKEKDLNEILNYMNSVLVNYDKDNYVKCMADWMYVREILHKRSLKSKLKNEEVI